MLPADPATRLETDDRSSGGDLVHRYTVSNFRRSLRDAVWYAGQVALLGLAYHDHPRALYLVLACFALLASGFTAAEAVRWSRELRRDAHAARVAAPGDRRVRAVASV